MFRKGLHLKGVDYSKCCLCGKPANGEVPGTSGLAYTLCPECRADVQVGIPAAILLDMKLECIINALAPIQASAVRQALSQSIEREVGRRVENIKNGRPNIIEVRGIHRHGNKEG